MRILIFLLLASVYPFAYTQTTMPAEWEPHEGTWLQWPHDYTYGSGTRSYFEDAWVEMTRELIKGERVHIIAYNETEQTHIEETLADAGIAPDSIDFFVHPNNDYWVRDNGPVFVRNTDNELLITDWGFNGWGNDAPYELCNDIPGVIASDIGAAILDINEIILEGGAIEHDGNGTFFGTVSSILGDGRNPGKTEADLETYLAEYLGFEQFIWLEGAYGGSFDITDSHIDGFLKFHDSGTIVTMSEADLNYWYVNAADRNLIFNATNIDGMPYDYVFLPLTDKNVKTEDGLNTGSKGSYVNYYVGNSVVLVPIYDDDNDSIALAILQDLMPDKEIVGIDCRNMYAWGGMVHCVTQQQPAGSLMPPVGIWTGDQTSWSLYPNPVVSQMTITGTEIIDVLSIYNVLGQKLMEWKVQDFSINITPNIPAGQYFIKIDAQNQSQFIYFSRQ